MLYKNKIEKQKLLTRKRNEVIFLFFHEGNRSPTWIVQRFNYKYKRSHILYIIRKMRKEYPHNFFKWMEDEYPQPAA